VAAHSKESAEGAMFAAPARAAQQAVVEEEVVVATVVAAVVGVVVVDAVAGAGKMLSSFV
jgi:hypothetical protein